MVLGGQEVLGVLVVHPHPNKHKGPGTQRKACSSKLQCVLWWDCDLISLHKTFYRTKEFCTNDMQVQKYL